MRGIFLTRPETPRNSYPPVVGLYMLVTPGCKKVIIQRLCLTPTTDDSRLGFDPNSDGKNEFCYKMFRVKGSDRKIPSNL